MTWLERIDPTHTWLGFLGAAGLGLTTLLVLLEPPPSFVLSPVMRIVFWTLHVFVVLALAQGCQVLISRHLAPRGNAWVAIVAAGLAASALLAPLALGLDLILVEPVDPGEDDRWSLAETLEEWINLAPPVTLVWLGLNAVRFLRFAADAPSPPVAGAPAGPTPPEFMRRVPAGRRGALIALSAELHYLRVYTTSGDALILKGFGEALAELGPETGLQVHRSHWIDPAFAAGVSREGGRMHVKLLNGLVVPVSRSRRAEVAAVIEGKATRVRA